MQKVYIWCIYTHSDINRIYKSENAGYLFLWISINKTKWMTDVIKIGLSTGFSVLVLIPFLLKTDILGLAMLI